MNGPSDGQPEKTTPFPSIEDDNDSPELEADSKDKGKDKDVTPKKKTPQHRRTISGNILKLLRSGSAERTDQDGATDTGRSAMSDAMGVTSKRRRKGSLRKTVLGKGRDKDRDRKGKSPLASPSIILPANDTPSSTSLSTPRPSAEYSPEESATSPEPLPQPPRWPFRSLSKISIPSIRSSIASVEPASSTASIRRQPTASDAGNLSTDEDDDEVQMPRLPALRKIPTASSIGGGDGSYFPSVSVSAAPSVISVSDSARRTSTGYFSVTHARSPLASSPQSVAGTPPKDENEDGHDYADTAFWGYVILIVSWVVFVVGMGSCFGVWSWAWDVGETPYAPPELEDDPSLPITGYYPALMVLTAVMAWVWVVVAWVGMKYFRHADFKGDDG
jgi:hypothetical protein